MMENIFKKPLEDDRMKFPRVQETTYNPITQVGNWYEERLKYCKKKYNHISTYNANFYPKEIPPRNTSFWHKKYRTKEIDPVIHPKTGCWDHPNFFQNFTSVYDLSYEYFPKIFAKHIERKLRFRMSRHEPIDEYLQSFNNLSKRGNLVEGKNLEWCTENSAKFFPPTTNSQDSFKPPAAKDYNFKRHSTPKCNSSKIYSVNHHAAFQNFRTGAGNLQVVPTSDLIQVERPPQCDPITWICPTVCVQRQ